MHFIYYDVKHFLIIMQNNILILNNIFITQLFYLLKLKIRLRLLNK